MEMATLYPLYRRVIRTESNIALPTTSGQDRKAGRSLIDFRSIRADIRLAQSYTLDIGLGSAGYPPTHINTIDSPLSRDLAVCPFLSFFFLFFLPAYPTQAAG